MASGTQLRATARRVGRWAGLLPARVATVATREYRPQLENLLRSLAVTNPAAEVTVFVNDREDFRGLPGRHRLQLLPQIGSLGVKRARFELYRRALQDGPFTYLDADIVVLGDLGRLLASTGLTACPDPLDHQPYLADPEHPWPGDPTLSARRYVNTGVLAFDAPASDFVDRAAQLVLDDRFWDRYALPPYLHDNHVFNALLNLELPALRLLDAREYNWPGFQRGGQLQVRREGGALINLETSTPLRLVHFAGIRDIEEFLDQCPFEISSLIRSRACGPLAVSRELALGLFAASLSSAAEAPNEVAADRFSATRVILREARHLARLLRPSDPSPASPTPTGLLRAPDELRAVAAMRPPAPVRWDGLRCGGPYLEPMEYAYLETLIAEQRLGSVLEAGCGETSLLFRRLGLSSFAIETAPGPWLERARQAGCRALLVPQREGHFEGAELAQAIAEAVGDQVDLLFIDAPPGTAARSLVARQLSGLSRPRFVLYHDALRDAANVIDDAIALGLQVIDRLPSPRGMVLLGREPLTVRPSAQLPRFDGRPLTNFGASLTVLEAAAPVPAAPDWRVRVELFNKGPARWGSSGDHPVFVAYHLCTPEGQPLVWDGKRTPLPFDLEPGHSAEFWVSGSGEGALGRALVELSLVQEGVRWFHQAEPTSAARFELEVRGPATGAARP